MVNCIFSLISHSSSSFECASAIENVLIIFWSAFWGDQQPTDGELPIGRKISRERTVQEKEIDKVNSWERTRAHCRICEKESI